jgi:hypothetical protein
VTTVAQRLATLIDARLRCARDGNTEWVDRHTEAIHAITKNQLPSGSGWDSGTTIDLGASTGECLVLFGDFHHMDEHGSYDGWTSHVIRVKASLISGLRLTIAGPNRNQIKDYLHELFDVALSREIKETE